MTALGANTRRDAKKSAYDMYHRLPVSATVEIYEGAGIVLSAGYAEPATAATSLTTAGVAQERVTGGTADGDVTVLVRQGIFGPFASGTSTDLIDAGDVGASCYWIDDDTVGLTDGSSSRSIAGTVYDVTSDGIYVMMALHPQTGLSGSPVIQTGTATLASGTATVDTTITLATTSAILLTWEDAAGDIECDPDDNCGLAVVARTAGAPGTGAFTINTVGNAAIDADGAGVVRWVILG